MNYVSQRVNGKVHLLTYPEFVTTCDVPVSVREYSTVFNDGKNGPNIQTSLNKDVLIDAFNILDKTFNKTFLRHVTHWPITPRFFGTVTL